MSRLFRSWLVAVFALVAVCMCFAQMSSVNAETNQIADHRAFTNAFLTNPRMIGKVTVVLGSAPTVSPLAGMIYVWYTVDGSGNLVQNYKLSDGTVKAVIETATAVPIARTVAGAALSADITAATLRTAVIAAGMYAADASITATPGAAVSVPLTRTVAGSALSSDITAAALRTAVIAAGMYSADVSITATPGTTKKVTKTITSADSTGCTWAGAILTVVHNLANQFNTVLVYDSVQRLRTDVISYASDSNTVTLHFPETITDTETIVIKN